MTFMQKLAAVSSEVGMWLWNEATVQQILLIIFAVWLLRNLAWWGRRQLMNETIPLIKEIARRKRALREFKEAMEG